MQKENLYSYNFYKGYNNYNSYLFYGYNYHNNLDYYDNLADYFCNLIDCFENDSQFNKELLKTQINFIKDILNSNIKVSY